MTSVLPVIKASQDFRVIARDGKRQHAGAFLVQIVKTGRPFRVGFTASRKTGNAVVRNRAKRRLREIVRAYLKVTPQPPACDIVLIARPAAAQDDFARMQADFFRIMAGAA